MFFLPYETRNENGVAGTNEHYKVHNYGHVPFVYSTQKVHSKTFLVV